MQPESTRALVSMRDVVYVVIVSTETPLPEIAPCGPECCHAVALPPAYGDWVWCTRRVEPRAIGDRALECPAFVPRSASAVGGTPFRFESRGGS